MTFMGKAKRVGTVSNQSLLRRLEPRIVFDGAALATGLDATPDQAGSVEDQNASAGLPVAQTEDNAAVDFSPEASTAAEIVIVDGRIKDADLLIAGLSPNAQVFTLDPAAGGIAQISEILSQQGGLSAIHIFSHGDAGKLFLGNGELTAANLGDNANAVSGWGEALSSNGDLLLWGCDVAATSEGAQFVSELSVLTGADVAASVDTTGASAQGGDWVLESQTGSIESDSPFGWSSLMAYAHVLNTAPDITPSAAQTVAEDTGLTFSTGTGTQITIADVDNNNLSMTLSVSNGTLTLGGTANLTNLLGNGTNSVTFQGLAADVTTALNGLIYQGTANFNGTDSLSVQANDGTATSNSAIGITVTAVEDGPQLVANSMTVAEGNTPSAVTLQTSDLQVTDAESGAADLTYSLVSLPSDGTLRVNGAAATLTTTFTQADIASGNVTYTHNGAENATDSLTFDVTDGAAQKLGTTTFTINVNAVNDALVEVAVVDGAVIESQALVIGESLLDHSDVDTADTSLVYTITAGSVLGEGTLTVNGATVGVGGTFTQAQINANQVVYTHTGGEPATAQNLSFSVTDGTTTNTGTVNIAVTPLNDTPTPSVNGLTLTEGTSSSFAAINVNVVDPDSSDEQIIYKIESLPTNGTLTLGGNPVVIGTTFSQAQLSTLSYAHNGSETTSDTFNFTARDGAGGVVASTAVPITVTPINDQVSANGSATIFEGQSGSVTLNISDNDDTAANITVRVDSLPANGTLFLNGVAIGSAPFSFAATQAGLLTYTHDGSDGVGGNPADTSFDITVTDSGGGTATPSSVTKTIAIDIQAVDDDPTLPTNVTATVAEGNTLTVSNTQLSATDVDSPDSTLTYQVESLPTSGVLLLDGVHIGVGATFTQADIDSGKLQYTNQSQSAGTDSFNFTLRDGQINIITGLQGALRQTPGGALDTQTFNINITEVNDAPVLTANTNQALTQGDTVTVTTASLNASDVDSTDTETIFTVTTIPSNGEIKLNGVALTNGQTFTLDDVKNNRVTYTHTTAQPTGTDTFQFQLTDSTGLPGSPATNTHSFIVTPAPPVPDNTGSGSNPTIGTNSAITVDEHGTGSLTGSLAASDDQAASDLIYRITTDAQFGQVLLNGAPLGVGSLFTQADIDAGLVTFKSDGSNDPAATQTDSDSITLTLIDGDGGEVTGIVVNFNISPINDAPVVSGPNSLVTSEDVSINVTGVSVTDVDEDATANAELKMTLSATAGTLSLSTIAGLTFTTGDGSSDASMVFTGTLSAINTALGTLSYLPNSNVGGTDTITIVANDQGNTGTDPGTSGDATSEEGTKTVNVTVRAINDAPTIGVNNTLSTVSEGSTGTITSALLAAADVDNGTTEQFFVVTSLPADGTLLLNGTALTKGGFFTQDDVNNNRVTYQHDGTENFRDTFNFTLTDGSTSAVTGTFNIEITPINDTPTVPTNTGMVLTEAQTKVITAAMLAVGDPDGSAEISLAEDNETFTITTAPGTGTILLDGATYAGEALTNAIIAAGRLSYQHDGSETFTDSMVITVNDNSATAGASHTTTATFNFVIAPLNDDPVVGNNVALVVDEAGSGTIGSTQLGSATTATVDPDNNERQVQYRVTSGVSTGQLFLSGKAISDGSSFTLEDIQQNRLTYTHDGGEVYTDAFNFRIEDGGGGFVDGTYNITINAINDTPVLTVPGAQSVDEDTNLAITGVSVADDDAHQGTNQVTATLSVTSGTITLATVSGLTFNNGANGDPSMTIQGTLSEVNAAIATLNYKGNANFNGSDTLNVNFNDLGNFGTDPGNSGDGTNEQADATIAITVGPINDAPTVTTPAGQNVTEDQTLTLSGGTAITIGDVDADDTAGDTLTVTVNATSGTLTLGTTSGLTGVSGDTSKSITFTGTRAEVNAALNGLVYDSDLNFSGTDTINVSVNDNGNTGSGGAKTGTGSLTVTVDALNDTPAVTVPANQTAPEDAQFVFNSTNNTLIQIADVDAGTGLIDVTVALSGATPGTVTLSQTSGLAFQSGTTNGSATITVRGTLANINAALDGAFYQGPTNTNGFTTTMTVSVDDRGNTGTDPGLTGTGSNEIDSATFDITVSAINDAPTVTTPAAQTATEDDATGVTFGNIGFADVDADASSDTMTVTLSVANGTVTLSAAAVTSIGSGNVTNNGTGTVTVTGTLDALNTAINTANTVTYVANANFAGSDPLTISVSDGGSTGADPSTAGLPATGTATTEVGTGTVAITVNAVNDAPTIAVPAAQTVNEDTNLVLAGGTAISIADIDSATSDVTATLTVTSGTLTANGSTGPLTSITGQGTNTLTLVGTASEINTAIASLTYLGTANANGSDTLNINVNDGGNTGVDPSTVGQTATGDANNEQANASVGLTITAINDTPTVTTPTQQTAATAAGVTFNTTNNNKISVGDVDIAGAFVNETVRTTVSVTTGTLTLGSTTGIAFITGANNSGSMVIEGTLAAINTALDGLQFVPGGDADTTATLTVTLNDKGNVGADPGLTGDSSSEEGTGTVDIQISEINDTPTITAPATVNGSEDTTIAFTGGNQVQVGDVDAFSSDLRVTLSVANGTLSLTPGTLAFSTGDGTSDTTMVFEGTLTEINTALATLTYIGDTGYNVNQGTETLNITVNDKGNTGTDPGTSGDATSEEATQAIGITIAAINDAPTLTVPGTQTVNEDTDVGITGISFADTDVGENPTGEMRVTLSASNGTLNLATVSGLSFISGSNDSSAMVIEGTLAEVNAAVATLTYKGTANFNGNDTISVTVNDKGNTGTDPGNTGDANSEEATATIGVTVNPINDTPTIATPAAQTVNEDTNLTIAGVTFADIDSAGDDVTATLSVTNGILTINSSITALTSATGSGTKDVTLVGTVAEINAAIAGMTYRGNLNFHGSDTLALSINDGGNNGADPGLTGTGANEVASANVGITVSPVNDAPTVPTPVSATTTEDAQVTINLTTGAVDVDGGTGVGDATINSYTVQTLPSAAQGVLFLSDGTTQVVAGNTLTPAQAAGLIFKPTADFNGGPVNFTYIATDSDGASSASATGAITVTPVNDAPTVTIPAAVSVNEDTNLTVTGVTFGDIDSATGDVTATLSVTNGILTITSSTTALTSATGSGTKDVTLVGTVAEINAAIAGMTYRGNLNFHGNDTLAMTINDGGNIGADPSTVGQPATGGATDEVGSANLAITVNPVNDAPTISTSVNVTTPEDTQIGIDLTTNAADVDGGTGVGDAAISTYTVQTLPTAAQGVLFLADGTTPVVAGNTLTPAQAAGLVFKPTANFNGGPFNFTYVTTDTDGASSTTATGAITVTAVNDTPTITAPAAQTVDEDTNLTITGTSFADIDAGTTDVTATISVGDGILTLAGTIGAGLAVSNDGSATVTLVGTVAEINAAITSITYRGDSNFHGADTLQLTINDQGNTGADPGLTGGAGNEQATASVGITVNQVNDPPTATPFTTTTPENTTVLVTLAATDPDGGTNTTTDAALNTITITALPPASEGVLTFSDGTTPVVAGTPITPAQAADLRFVPALNFNGTVNVTFIATDTAGTNSASATGTVIVSSTNTAPSLATNTGFTVNEGQPVTLANTALSVTDPDNTAGQVTFTVNTVPANGQILKNGSALGVGGTFTQDDIDNGRVTYQHNGSETTNDTFDVTATDPGGLNTGGTITVPVTVNPVNDAPTLVVPGAQTTAEDTSLAVTGITVADVDAGTSDMTVTVSAPNGTLTTTANGSLTSVSGAGTGTLTLTGSATALNTALATLSYDPNLNFNGADTITVLISDGGNTGADPSSIGVAGTGTTTDEQASSTIGVTVTAVNDIPVANTTPGTPDVVIEPGGTFTGVITDYFTDPDGGPYTFAIGTPPANGTLVITDPATGQFEYTPAPGFEGTDTFGFTVDGAAIPFPTPVNVQVTILVLNTNVAFIDPSVGQPADIPGGGQDGGLGNDVPGVTFDPRQIQFGDGDLNLLNNNEYIRAVVEDRIDALERQYGAASGGEVLGAALDVPLENRNNNANIGEVTLSGPAAGTGGFFGGGSSPQVLGLSNLPTEAGGPQPPAEDGQEEESGNSEDQPPENQEEEEENLQGAPEEPTGAADQEGDTPPPATGDQTGIEAPAASTQYASTEGLRFSEQIAAEAQRMEQQRVSLLGALNGLAMPEPTDLPRT